MYVIHCTRSDSAHMSAFSVDLFQYAVFFGVISKSACFNCFLTCDLSFYI